MVAATFGPAGDGSSSVPGTSDRSFFWSGSKPHRQYAQPCLAAFGPGDLFFLSIRTSQQRARLPQMKSKVSSIIGAIALVAVISAAASWLTLRLLAPPPSGAGVDYHQWIHDQLKMTAEQESQLLPSERRYEESRRHLEETIRIANADLARAIREDKEYSPDVERAVAEIHEAMGLLQRATLEHIFEMKAVLDSDQYDRLMELTVEGLSENTRRD